MNWAIFVTWLFPLHVNIQFMELLNYRKIFENETWMNRVHVRGGSSFFPRGGGGVWPNDDAEHRPLFFWLFWTPVSDVFLASTVLTAWWRFSMHRRCPSRVAAIRFFLLFWTPVSDVFLASTLTTWWRFSMHISHVHLAAQGGGGGLNPIVWGWAWDRVL